MALTREQMAKRAAQEIEDGYYVNLGIGMPTLVANYIPADKRVVLQSENGLLGIGPYPTEAELDPELINAGKETITMIPGAGPVQQCRILCHDPWRPYRPGHPGGDGGLSDKGDLANWVIPGKMVKGMGGAMDLVHGAKRIVVIMEHCNKQGESKILKQCTLPLTGKGVVNRIISDLAVMDVTPAGLVLRETAPGVTVEQVMKMTEAVMTVSPDLKTITV